MNGGSGILAPRPAIGTTAMLINTMLIPIMGVTVKTLAHMEISTLEMLAWRSLIVVAMLLPFLALAHHRLAILSADIRAHAVHAVFAISSMACFYYALRTLPIATVTSINFTTPIFGLLLARLLFKDQVSVRGWLAMAVGFGGAVLILRPDAQGIGLDALVVLFGSLLAAAMNLTVRQMPARSSNFAVVFYLSLFGAILYGVLGASSLRVPDLPEFSLFMALGLIALGVHTCVTFTYRFSSSMLIGALDYLRIIWAVLFGYAIFGDHPDLLDGVGIVLIISSGWVILRMQRPGAKTETV